MPTIHITTFIAAPIELVFDLARSIDLHKKSLSHTKEEPVAGVRTGLINLDETVTWKAKHLGKSRILKSKIVVLEHPILFIDEMMEGDFKSLRHEHHFKKVENGTLMIDIFNYESPYGTLGRLFNKVYLTTYLRKLLDHHNRLIKEYAESDKWRQLLNK